MLDTINTRAAAVGDTFFTASRQVWLASLGAAVVTRDWAEKEAGVVFRNLVREGTLVESKAVRAVGDRIETSFTRANRAWRKTRTTVTTTVRAYADSAVALARELPISLPRPAVAVHRKAGKRPAGRPRKGATVAAPAKRARTAAKRTRKSTKRA